MMKRKEKTEEKNTRIAIVNSDRCKPNKCNQECKKNCPVVRIGKLCIEVDKTSKITNISEELCTGCGICVKKCPFNAITIINLPTNLESETSHRYGPNSFKLHRLPTPRLGQVLGLVGCNGIGKTTALKILANKLKPNLGNYNNPPEWKDIITYYRGNDLQNYLSKLQQGNIISILKPQNIDLITKLYSIEKAGDILREKNKLNNLKYLYEMLDLQAIDNKSIGTLSGGELQRFAIAIACSQKADIYMFDEPSNYLDIYQRLKVAQVIRNMCTDKTYVIVVEHDLSILDYMSDFVCCLYGQAGAYGVVTFPSSVRDGINTFINGFISSENLRFRETGLSFKKHIDIDIDETEKHQMYKYPLIEKKFNNFELTVDEGNYSDSEIMVLLGQNGTGKTTFIKMIAGILKPDNLESLPELYVSYKPQIIDPKFQGTVRQLLQSKINNMLVDQQFISNVLRPLNMEDIYDNMVQELSGGEKQKVAIVLALGKPAKVYLIDEPSANLDSEQRMIVSKAIKKFVKNTKSTAFIVEHDFIMATYLADRVIVFDGEPSINCQAHKPQTLSDGMNQFLKNLNVTFRRDPSNHRPRINKNESLKDREQKLSGIYFNMDSFDND